jgi:predicted ester cyclase
MNKLDIVNSVMVGSGYSDKGSLYTDDFQATNSVGEPPFDKNTWLGMEELLMGSFPDFDFVIDEIEEDSDGVWLTGHFAGTFTKDLDLTAMGVGVIPASGKKVTWPNSRNLISFEGDKISRWHTLDTGPDAGMSGFLRPLGVG